MDQNLTNKGLSGKKNVNIRPDSGKCLKREKTVLCCFCAREIPYMESNNPRPVYENGRCCSECNRRIVIPTRLRLIWESRERDA